MDRQEVWLADLIRFWAPRLSAVHQGRGAGAARPAPGARHLARKATGFNVRHIENLIHVEVIVLQLAQGLAGL